MQNHLLGTCAFILCLLLWIDVGEVRSDETGIDRAQQLKKALSEAISEVRTMESEFSMSFDRKKPLFGAKLDRRGNEVLYSFHWLADRREHLFLLDGELGFSNRGIWQYHRQVWSWDGTNCIAYHAGENSALVTGDPEGLRSVKTPDVLIGDNLLGKRTEQLIDVLSRVKSLSVKEGKEPTLTGTFAWNDERSGDPAEHEASSEMRLEVTVATGAGNLPRRITIHDIRTDTPSVVMVVERFQEVSPGRWFPSEGSLTNFRAKPVRDEVLEKKFEAAPPEQQAELRKQARFKAEKLGVGTMRFELQPHSIRLNQNYQAADFLFIPPKTARTWDDRTDLPFQPPK